MTRHCWNCGETVGDLDWTTIGRRRVFVCDGRDCNRAADEDDRDAYKAERERALRDEDERYGR